MALLLTPAYWLCAVLLAALAVCWAYVLVQPGMLLAPVQAWVRDWYRTRYAAELDARWWFAPLWGCYACVSGQAGFWGYLLLFPLASYSLLAHLGFAALTILFAAIWRAIYACSQSVQ